MFMSSYIKLAYISLFSHLFHQTIASPARTPTCYPDDGQFPAPNFSDCVHAMTVVRNSPFFSRPQTYGAFEDPPRNVPIDWHYKTCLITIGIEDGSKKDTFALSATMPAFAAVEDKCIRKKKLGQGFGGFVPVGNGRGFFAIVQFDPDYQYAPGISKPLSNGTVVGTDAETS